MPLLKLEVGLIRTVYGTVADAVPEVVLTVIQGTELVAVQEQGTVPVVVAVTVCAPPDAGTACDVVDNA
jgi:hypothetical protein